MALSFFLLGLIVGSFLNVLIVRSGTKRLTGRSQCLSCGVTIRWYDNIPLLSFLLLRGRCRSCGSRISLQYPLVELSTAILFVLFEETLLPFSLVFLMCAIGSVLIMIFVYDLRHTIIPDPWVYSFCVLSLVYGLSLYVLGPFYIMAGPIAASPLFLLWLLSKGKWMGLGDAKLALGIGWLLGGWYGFVAVTFAFVLGALFSIAILLPLPYIAHFLREWGIVRLSAASTRFTMKSEVPFGPFLIASTFLIWLSLLFHLPLPL